MITRPKSQISYNNYVATLTRDYSKSLHNYMSFDFSCSYATWIPCQVAHLDQIWVELLTKLLMRLSRIICFKYITIWKPLQILLSVWAYQNIIKLRGKKWLLTCKLRSEKKINISTFILIEGAINKKNFTLFRKISYR